MNLLPGARAARPQVPRPRAARPERGRLARKSPGARAARPRVPGSAACPPASLLPASPSAPFPSLRCSVPPSPLATAPTSRFFSIAVSLLAPVATLLAADAARPSAVPDVSFSVLRVFGALALVFALFLGAVWLFRNWQRLTLNRGRPSKLNVLEVRALGQRHALYVIGYQHQRVLVGTSPGGVSLLSHLPDDDSPPEAQPRAATFSEIWQHLRERKP